MSTTRWLDETEQGAWRAWLEVMRLLPNHLEDRLHERHGLTLTDYQVLVEVSESEQRRLRMTELSHRTQLSKSRLSHQIGRMERAGLVVRTQCPEDRRGQWAELTEQGWAVLHAAAPDKLSQSPATGCTNAMAELEAASSADAAVEAVETAEVVETVEQPVA